jgi:hypothetical protein
MIDMKLKNTKKLPAMAWQPGMPGIGFGPTEKHRQMVSYAAFRGGSSHSLVARKTNVDHTAIPTRHYTCQSDMDTSRVVILTIQSIESEIRTTLDRSYMACVRVSKITDGSCQGSVCREEMKTCAPRWQFLTPYTRWQSSAAGDISAMCVCQRIEYKRIIHAPLARGKRWSLQQGQRTIKAEHE